MRDASPDRSWRHKHTRLGDRELVLGRARFHENPAAARG